MPLYEMWRAGGPEESEIHDTIWARTEYEAVEEFYALYACDPDTFEEVD